jgi:hypothetical protein
MPAAKKPMRKLKPQVLIVKGVINETHGSKVVGKSLMLSNGLIYHIPTDKHFAIGEKVVITRTGLKIVKSNERQ